MPHKLRYIDFFHLFGLCKAIHRNGKAFNFHYFVRCSVRKYRET